MSKEFEETFLQRRYTSGQHEKMPNIISHQGNASRNHCVAVGTATIFLKESSLGDDVEDLEPSYFAGLDCGRQFLKKSNIIHCSRSWQQPKCPSTGAWRNKMWPMHTVEYYSVKKRDEILVNGAAGVKLENTIRSEISQAQRKTLDYSAYI